MVKSCSSTCAGRPTTAQLRSHIKKGGSIRTAQRAFGGKKDNLEIKYAEAKGALPDVHVELPEDCVKIHKLRMQLLFYLLKKRSRHAVLQSFRTLEPGTAAIQCCC